MKQQDFRLPSPQWPLGRAGAPGSKSLVGGVPWASEANGQEPFADRSGVGAADAAPDEIANGLPRVFDPAIPAGPAAAAALSGSGGVGERLKEFIRNSPAFSVSLSLHCLLLLLLTLWVVRERPLKKLRLSLAFGPANVQANDNGIDIVPAKEPTKQPDEVMTEVAKTDLPTVNSPQAAPTPKPEMPDVAVGTADADKPMVAPAVGMLLAGREAGRKEVLLGAAGGGDVTELAVTLALDWLKKQQNQKDGLWSLTGPYDDGGSQENQLAATAMALLAFQGAGNTFTEGPHRAVVARAWRSLLRQQQEDGSFDVGQVPMQHALYSHAQATMALCELYGMSRDPKLAEPAARAVAYCVAAQGPNGGWRYEPGKPGDMSVTGWYVMALKTAEMAGMGVPVATFEGIGGFLDTVASGNGSRYGYRRDSPLKPAGPVTAAVTAEGLLCRQYLGWPQKDPRLVEGLELLMAENPLDFESDTKDVYAWYYITQVAHHMEGEAWRRWNDRLREVLPREQAVKGKQRGSWDPSLDKWGHIGGRLFVTSFCVYMLETYYRHLPLYAAQQAKAP
jgi:hypothetical protein